MPKSVPRPNSNARHPWPRVLVRLRRSWLGWMEVLSFLAAVTGAVGRFLIGRWPEPPGRDYLAPKGPDQPPALTSRKARS
jgi:hypothetical protein